MRDVASSVNPFLILSGQALTATASGTGVNVTPSELFDAMAVAVIGVATGTPTSFTVVITIENSATVNGTYTTLATIPGTATVAGQTGSVQVKVNPLKPFIRATATIVFVGGTSPAINVAVALLVRQSVSTDSNNDTLA